MSKELKFVWVIDQVSVEDDENELTTEETDETSSNDIGRE